MNVLSLFSGIGGLELGLERAGMTVVGQVEIDPFCRQVLAKHWPEVPRHDDVRTAVEWWLGGDRPAVDVVAGGFPCQPVSLAGGFPCQPVSLAGRRLAQADERWLWPAAWAVIRDLRPRFAILENVPGLLARGAGDVLADLAEIGYDAEWDCVPAAAVGAPHRRDRVFVVAYPAGEPRRLQPEPESRGGGATVARHDGPHWELAHANGAAGGRAAREAEPSAGRRAVRQWTEEPRRRDCTLAHADGNGLVRAGLPEPHGHGPSIANPGRGGSRVFGRGVRPGGIWSTEPEVGRVAHGLPARMVRDELHALGNAVVPQVAEHIGRLVMGAAA